MGWLTRGTCFVAGLIAIFWILPRFGVWAPLAHAVLLVTSISIVLFQARQRDK